MIQRINHLNLEQKLGLMNEESQGMYDYNRDIKFKKLMIRSSLCNYCDP